MNWNEPNVECDPPKSFTPYVGFGIYGWYIALKDTELSYDYDYVYLNRFGQTARYARDIGTTLNNPTFTDFYWETEEEARVFIDDWMNNLRK